MWKKMKPLDRALLVVLAGLYAAGFALFFYEHVRGHQHPQYLQVHGAPSPDAYPVVTETANQAGRLAPGLEPGDVLIEMSGTSLKGASAWRTLVVAASAPDADGVVPTVLERDGERMRVLVEPHAAWGWLTWLIPLTFGIAGVLAFVGAAGAEHARAFTFACFAFGAHMMLFDSPSPFVSALGLATFVGGGVLVGPLSLRALQRIPAEHAPISRWSRIWPWIFLVSGVSYSSAILGFPFDAKIGMPISMAGNVGVAATGIFIIVRNYRRADPAGRRQVRWIALGVCVGIGPTLIMSLVVLADPSAFPLFLLANVSFLAIPVCFIVAIVGYGAFDLDRIVAATLAFAAALAVGLLVALGVAEPAARALAALVGTSEDAAEAGLLVALAFGVLPAARRLQPRLFASFFPARARLQSELDAVLAGFADCDSEHALAQALEQGLVELMGPSWQLAVAETDHDGLRVVFDTRAGDAPLPSEPDLRRLLAARAPVRIERRGAPLQRRRRLEASTHDRLEAAGVAVAVPVHIPDLPSWAILLGRKETGDVFPANELELLGRIAGRVSLELMRIRAADLAVQNRAEREIHVARSKFLAATSHDLRQPLHSFGLHLGALSTDDLTPRGRMLVGQLERSLGELQQQFESVLQVSKLDAGVVEPKVGPFALGPMIESLRASLEPVAASRGLTLEAPATGAWVESDPLLLGRIVRNLAENALRYTTEGGVRIDVERRGERVRIEVRDTGPGIAPGDRDAIFSEFSRGAARESSGDAAPTGLGLGLSIVERLARLLEHEVGLESTPGSGSAFWVEVPLADAPRERAGTSAPTAPIVPSELAGATIWVVDDEATVLEGLEALLQAWGCETVTAKSGGEALSKLEAAPRPPDVVIVDDQLGNESGTDVVDAFIDELGARDDWAPPEFLFVTGNTDANRLAELSATGCTVLNKPVPVMRLRAALAHALAARAAGGDA